MATLPVIPLNDDWTCEYIESGRGLADSAGDMPIPSLMEWVFESRRGEGWTAWLRRGFDLRPTDDCVSYFLCIDSALEDMQIRINGERVGVYNPPGAGEPPFAIDVTPYVALEYNEIAFRVDWNAAGRFEGVRLQAVPCA